MAIVRAGINVNIYFFTVVLMRKILIGMAITLMFFSINNLSAEPNALMGKSVRILFLHHSTGENVWNGGVEGWLNQYNSKNNAQYNIEEMIFPSEPYEWANYPYDYWLLWVKNAGKGYKGQPTLESLARKYDVIIWKQCFPGSEIEEDGGSPSVSSKVKTLENYKLQYAALKKKMREFPNVRFIVWTPAVELNGNIDAAQAKRTRDFAKWVVQDWDEKGDNIFVWDFYSYETDGGLFMKRENSVGKNDAHPNKKFSSQVAPNFARRIVDVIEGRGDSASVLGR